MEECKVFLMIPGTLPCDLPRDHCRGCIHCWCPVCLLNRRSSGGPDIVLYTEGCAATCTLDYLLEDLTHSTPDTYWEWEVHAFTGDGAALGRARDYAVRAHVVKGGLRGYTCTAEPCNGRTNAGLRA